VTRIAVGVVVTGRSFMAFVPSIREGMAIAATMLVLTSSIQGVSGAGY
jgi:hypothetical protein